jgi:hypothetical protein
MKKYKICEAKLHAEVIKNNKGRSNQKQTRLEHNFVILYDYLCNVEKELNELKNEYNNNK